ncbi:unnamed protein product [Prorocentrum cordatum]|uniref:Uncharacterized protein n=1 Tax=Prorocentrum cordatum TaxID=2364126 RepID=A0ABN9PR78_9DINO|nr:unnamed protein product [Polarella glacialis]
MAFGDQVGQEVDQSAGVKLPGYVGTTVRSLTDEFAVETVVEQVSIMLQVEGTSSLAQQIVPKGEFVGQALVEKALLGEPVFPDLVVIGECGGIDGEGLQEFENAAKAPTEAVADAEAQQKMEAARKRSWLATGEANHAAYVRAAAAEEAPLTEVDEFLGDTDEAPAELLQGAAVRGLEYEGLGISGAERELWDQWRGRRWGSGEWPTVDEWSGMRACAMVFATRQQQNEATAAAELPKGGTTESTTAPPRKKKKKKKKRQPKRLAEVEGVFSLEVGELVVLTNLTRLVENDGLWDEFPLTSGVAVNYGNVAALGVYLGDVGCYCRRIGSDGDSEKELQGVTLGRRGRRSWFGCEERRQRYTKCHALVEKLSELDGMQIKQGCAFWRRPRQAVHDAVVRGPGAGTPLGRRIVGALASARGREELQETHDRSVKHIWGWFEGDQKPLSEDSPLSLWRLDAQVRRLQTGMDEALSELGGLRRLDVEVRRQAESQAELEKKQETVVDTVSSLRNRAEKTLRECKQDNARVANMTAASTANLIKDTRERFSEEVAGAVRIMEDLSGGAEGLLRDVQSLSRELDTTNRRLDQEVQEIRTDLDTMETRLRRDKQASDETAQRLTDRVATSSDASEAATRGLEHLSQVVSMALQSERMAVALELQDFLDRKERSQPRGFPDLPRLLLPLLHRSFVPSPVADAIPMLSCV